MGSLQEKIAADMKAAMKAGDHKRVAVLRMLIAALKDEQLRGGSDDLDRATELAVLQRAARARRDAAAQAEQLGRKDVADSERAEVEVIQGYLPPMLTGSELELKVRELAQEIGYRGASDTGRFMKAWMARYPGAAEGRDVQAALRALG